MDVSAVCQYQIGDVKKVFDGAFKEYREASQRWGRYTGAVPAPRPGSVRSHEPCAGTRMVFCAPAFFFFVNYCITNGEMNGLERAREVGIAWWGGGTEMERAKAGTTRKANSVMIRDERKGSRGRGVMAGGGESGSERKTREEEKRGGRERAIISKPSSRANLSQLQLKSFLFFLLVLLLGPLALPFFLASVPFHPPFPHPFCLPRLSVLCLCCSV